MTKSACTRASLIPYPVIAAAVGGDPRSGEPGSPALLRLHRRAVYTDELWP